jgi:hypothetical protein
MPQITPGHEPERRLWPWVILALLLAAGITLFFVYAPRHATDPAAGTSLAAARRG